MTIITISGRDFNQDVAGAKRAAKKGPVIITDRGQPAFVLQRYDEWRRQADAKPARSLLEMLADPDSGDVEFVPERSKGPIARPVDFG